MKAIPGSLLAAGILVASGCHGSPAGAGDAGGHGGADRSGGSGGASGAGGVGGIAFDGGGDSAPDAPHRCQRTTFAAGFAALPVSLVDVNGDQVPDLIAPEGVFAAPAHMAVAVADGAGSFHQPTSWLDVQVGTEFFAGGDFDGDGNVDVIGLSVYGAIQLFRGSGNGQLAPATLVTHLNGSGDSVVAADFNEDSKVDIAAGASGPGRLEVLLGQGNGTFGTSIVLTIGQLQTPATLLTGDFDEDGHKDLLVYAAAQAGGQALILLGHGDGSFTKQQIFSLVNITGLATADLNRDGHTDLVATYGNNYLTVQLGAGDGTFSGVAGLRPNTKAQSDHVIADDVSGDGIVDVIVGNNLPDTMSILVGHGDGTFDDGVIIPLRANGYWIRAGDLNRDDVADLVTGNNTDVADIYLGPCP